MRALDVVMAAPAFDDDLRLGKAVEDLPVEQFVAELGVEALTLAVLPGPSTLHEAASPPDVHTFVLS
jgi:hypothetical protein